MLCLVKIRNKRNFFAILFINVVLAKLAPTDLIRAGKKGRLPNFEKSEHNKLGREWVNCTQVNTISHDFGRGSNIVLPILKTSCTVFPSSNAFRAFLPALATMT